ncbi:MAG: hypothetical protein LBD47_03695 [Treponema sp.]|nr:hypothetical protein [Treponema sp.]
MDAVKWPAGSLLRLWIFLRYELYRNEKPTTDGADRTDKQVDLQPKHRVFSWLFFFGIILSFSLIILLVEQKQKMDKAVDNLLMCAHDVPVIPRRGTGRYG